MQVLITGGTGFFSRAFVRELLKQDVERMCIYSRDEYKQSVMRDQFKDDYRLRWFIGDVRDEKRLTRAMDGVDVVIHAAALKRIEVGHYCPDEMVKTNVIGSMNVIEGAKDAGVQKVVALSTDKAYQPVSAYGHSKALAETLFLSANNKFGGHGPKFSVTRYGNVSNSTGSVIRRWRELSKTNPYVPGTDPDCTRFWMFECEAVDFVMETIRTMPNDVVIPELPAFRLGDLAEAMGVSVEYKGLPAWEKMHESMCEGRSSDKARRMSVEELSEALNHV